MLIVLDELVSDRRQEGLSQLVRVAALGARAAHRPDSDQPGQCGVERHGMIEPRREPSGIGRPAPPGQCEQHPLLENTEQGKTLAQWQQWVGPGAVSELALIEGHRAAGQDAGSAALEQPRQNLCEVRAVDGLCKLERTQQIHRKVDVQPLAELLLDHGHVEGTQLQVRDRPFAVADHVRGPAGLAPRRARQEHARPDGTQQTPEHRSILLDDLLGMEEQQCTRPRFDLFEHCFRREVGAVRRLALTVQGVGIGEIERGGNDPAPAEADLQQPPHLVDIRQRRSVEPPAGVFQRKLLVFERKTIRRRAQWRIQDRERVDAAGERCTGLQRQRLAGRA